MQSRGNAIISLFSMSIVWLLTELGSISILIKK